MKETERESEREKVKNQNQHVTEVKSDFLFFGLVLSYKFQIDFINLWKKSFNEDKVESTTQNPTNMRDSQRYPKMLNSKYVGCFSKSCQIRENTPVKEN